ncbi:MAG: dihydrofolate reductase [Mariniblastus sp.]|nr:dihydrofolate reductase [Mariniblastus sp.]
MNDSKPATKSIAMIVAAAENGVIGVNGDLPWRLSSDLKRFKKLTMGHHIIMGRKTFDSIGRLLPGRKTVVVTRQKEFEFEGAVVVHSIEEAIEVCQHDDSPFVTGGAEIYRLAMPLVNEIQLTRVHTEIVGDTLLPEIDWNQWELVESQRHPADDKNEVEYSFEVYRRR